MPGTNKWFWSKAGKTDVYWYPIRSGGPREKALTAYYSDGLLWIADAYPAKGAKDKERMPRGIELREPKDKRLAIKTLFEWE